MDKRVLNSMNKFYKYMDDVEGYKILSDFKGMSKYITLKHENCGNIYKTTPSHFMNREQRCAKCNGVATKRFYKYKKEYEDYISKQNNYTMLEEYKGNHEKIKMKHDVCGHVWKVAPSKFKYMERRCPYCNGGSQFTNDMFLRKFYENHDNSYIVLDKYTNASIKISIKHSKCNNIFLATPHNLMKKNNPTGCPLCYSSHGEKQVRQILRNMGFNFCEQKTFKGLKNINPLKFDFYIPELNTVIEYNGKQHYEPIEFFGGVENFLKAQHRDNLKKEYCKENEIYFLEIPYHIKDIEKFIIEKLNK